MILLLLAALLLPQDPRLRDLVEKLRDDSVEVRDRAAEELAALGRDAVPALEALRAGADSDFRGRLDAILRTIALQETLRKSYRPGAKLSVDHVDAPVADILADLARRSGDAFRFDAAAFTGRATLRLRDATLWDALHGLSAAAPLTWTVQEERLEFSAKPRPPFPSKRQAEFQVWLDSVAAIRELDFSGTPRESLAVGLNAAWERGIAPAAVELRITEALDAQGNSLLPPERSWYAPRSDPPKGRAIRIEPRYALAPGAEGLKAVARLRGHALFTFALGWEEASIELGAGQPSAKVGDFSVAVRGFRAQKSGAGFELVVSYPAGSGAGAVDRLPMRNVTLIDDQGGEHRIANSARSMAYGGAGFTVTENVFVPLPEGRGAVRLNFRILREVHEKRVGFDFRDLPLE
jgi:hypothetical protein